MSETKDLQVLVNESGLDSTKARVLLDNFSDAFDKASEWELQAKQLVVTNASQISVQKMARTLRLEIRQVRLDVETTRKSLKEQAFREGKAIDGIANVLKALMVPLEEHLDKQENFVKYANDAAEEVRRIEAERLLVEKEEAERAAEEEAIRKQAEENERLRKEADEKERAAAAECAEAARVLAVAEAKAAAARQQADENLQRERAAAQAAAARAQAEAEAELAEERRKAAAETERVRKEAEAKAEAEAEAIQIEFIKKERDAEVKREKELARARQVKCPRCGLQFDSAEHTYANFVLEGGDE